MGCLDASAPCIASARWRPGCSQSKTRSEPLNKFRVVAKVIAVEPPLAKLCVRWSKLERRLVPLSLSDSLLHLHFHVESRRPLIVCSFSGMHPCFQPPNPFHLSLSLLRIHSSPPSFPPLPSLTHSRERTYTQALCLAQVCLQAADNA